MHRHVAVSVSRCVILWVSGAQMCWGGLLPTSRNNIPEILCAVGRGCERNHHWTISVHRRIPPEMRLHTLRVEYLQSNQAGSMGGQYTMPCSYWTPPIILVSLQYRRTYYPHSVAARSDAHQTSHYFLCRPVFIRNYACWSGNCHAP